MPPTQATDLLELTGSHELILLRTHVGQDFSHERAKGVLSHKVVFGNSNDLPLFDKPTYCVGVHIEPSARILQRRGMSTALRQRRHEAVQDSPLLRRRLRAMVWQCKPWPSALQTRRGTERLTQGIKDSRLRLRLE